MSLNVKLALLLAVLAAVGVSRSTALLGVDLNLTPLTGQQLSANISAALVKNNIPITAGVQSFLGDVAAQVTISLPLELCCRKLDGTCDPAIFRTTDGYTLEEAVNLVFVPNIIQCLLSVAIPKINCGLCKCTSNCPASGANGDPHIKGFDGSNYLLWGKPNTTYSLISERNHQVNVRLYHPPGRVEAHALYIDAVGALIGDTRITVALVPGSPSAIVLGINGDTVTYPGRRMNRAIDAATSFTFEAPDRVVIASRDITFAVLLVENDHLDVQVMEVAAYWSDVHGIIGQTHSKAFQLKYSYDQATVVGDLPTTETMAADKKQLSLKGKEDDYITSGVLKADDKFNRFVGTAGLTTATATRKMLSSGLVKSDAGVASGGLPAGMSQQRKLLADPVFQCTK